MGAGLRPAVADVSSGRGEAVWALLLGVVGAVEDVFEFESRHFVDAADEEPKGEHHNDHAGDGDDGPAPEHHFTNFGVELGCACWTDDDDASENVVERAAKEEGACE